MTQARFGTAFQRRFRNDQGTLVSYGWQCMEWKSPYVELSALFILVFPCDWGVSL